MPRRLAHPRSTRPIASKSRIEFPPKFVVAGLDRVGHGLDASAQPLVGGPDVQGVAQVHSGGRIPTDDLADPPGGLADLAPQRLVGVHLGQPVLAQAGNRADDLWPDQAKFLFGRNHRATALRLWPHLSSAPCFMRNAATERGRCRGRQEEDARNTGARPPTACRQERARVKRKAGARRPRQSWEETPSEGPPDRTPAGPTSDAPRERRELGRPRGSETTVPCCGGATRNPSRAIRQTICPITE